MKKLLIYFSLLLLTACNNYDNICRKKNRIAHINSVQLNLEIACSDEDKKQGLMHRTSLPINNGMMFVFDTENYYSFWMKNTLIPLDIAFLDKQFAIVDIKSLKANDLTEVPTKAKAMYAIEMNQGWFISNNIKIGDKLKIVN